MVDDGHVLGMSLAVVDGGEVVYSGGFGRTSVETEGVAVTPTTLFDIGSISKVLLGALVMRLVEAGSLDLDRPVETYLDRFAFDDRALGPRVTLRHVLSHTSGLPAAGKDWGPSDPDALRDFVFDQLAHYRFFAPPGRLHLYSNTAICLAGHVAEAVTGRTYRDLVQTHVLDPLGMSRTTFDRAVAMTYRLALPHEEQEDGRLATVHRWTDNRSGEPSSFAISSALDLANLARMHLNRGLSGKDRFLTPETVATMHSPHADRRVAGASHSFAHLYAGYGLAVMTGTYRGAHVVRHGGTSQRFNCFFELLPDHRRGFVLLTNFGQDERLGELEFFLYDRLLGLAQSARTVALPPARSAEPGRRTDQVGTFLDPQGGRLASVRRDGNDLVLEHDGRIRPLVPLGDDEYYVEEANGPRIPVAFVAEDDTPSEYLLIGGQPFRRFAPEPTFVSDPGAWSRLVGDFTDPSNLGDGGTLRVHLDGDRLRLTGDWTDEDLIPIGPSRFLSSIGLIELDGAGRTLTVAGATRYRRSTETAETGRGSGGR